MKLESVGDVIATREFYLQDNPKNKIVVRLGRPQRFPDTPDRADCFCPFQIVGTGDEEVSYIAGIDGFQAISLTLSFLGSTLARLNHALGNRIRWECDESGCLGFLNPLEERP